MATPLRVGVIGAGAFGERHVRAYTRLPGVEVVGIADRDAERARAVADRFAIAHWFQDGTELMDTCGLDGVSVVTSGSDHQAPTLAALERGLSVLLEKPVALCVGDVDKLEDAVSGSAGFVMPAHILRFAAPYIELRARLRAGSVGELLGISAVRNRGRGHSELFADVHPALMTMIHDIDLAMWLSEARAIRVSAQARGSFADGRPSLLFASVEASDGSVWSLRANWLLPDEATPTDRLEVYGAEGAMFLDQSRPSRCLVPPSSTSITS